MEVETVEGFGTVGTVLGRQVLDNEFPRWRSIDRRGTLRCRPGLLFDVGVLQNPPKLDVPVIRALLNTKDQQFAPVSADFKHLSHHKIVLPNPITRRVQAYG